jgi:potassium efflux system protein
MENTCRTKMKLGALAVCFLFGVNAVWAQHQKTVPLQQRILDQISRNDSSMHVSGASDTVVPYLINKEERLSLDITKISSFYRHGLDTLDISAQLPRTESDLKRFKDIIDTRGRRMNLRSLNSSLVLMQQFVDNLKEWQTTLNGYSTQMDAITESVERIVDDSTVKSLPADTALFRLAVGQLQDIDTKYKQVDTLERQGLTRVGLLQNRVEAAYLQATNLVDEINFRIKMVKRQIWNREEDPIWKAKPSDYSGSLFQDLMDAVSRGLRVTSIYMEATWDTRTIALVALIIITVWTWFNLRKIKTRGDTATTLAPVHFVKHTVFVSCLVLVLTFATFLETNIPMSYLHLTGLIHLIGLAILMPPYLTSKGKELGIWMMVLWLGYTLDDLLGETAYGERWLLLAGALASMYFCYRMLQYEGHVIKGITFPNVTKPLASFAFLAAFLSLVFDIGGRITLSKLIGLTGIHSIVYAMTLWVSSNIVIEVIYIQSEAYKNTRFSAFLNFKELQQRFQVLLRILCGIFWVILLTRNLSIYEPFYEAVTAIISKQRTIGSLSFSLGSIFIFVLILWISSILSQFVTFIFGNQGSSQGSSSGGRSLNTAAISLMARLGILALGFFIAIGAAGIPLTKISFIVGALGVGIGFGLQTIVNNLVSGIILTFERPIQVGDQVEVSGKSGIVKEIGIRASKISNFDGADIIIPNGDLLSQTLTNWTLSNRNRRITLNIRTNRDAGLGKITELIKGVLEAHKDIMSNPGPSVLITGFGGNWVEYQVLFWSEDLSNTGGLTHAVIQELNDALDKAGVILANPGQDIYIRSEPGSSQDGPGVTASPGIRPDAEAKPESPTERDLVADKPTGNADPAAIGEGSAQQGLPNQGTT